jgi:hypothetical protein
VRSARRLLATASAVLAIVLLGFVVAMAARSLPGQTVDEPIFTLAKPGDFDISEVLAWALLALAVVGGVLFALGMRGLKPREERRGRGMLGLLIGVIVFVAAYRWLRPLAVAFFSDHAAAPSETVGDGGTASPLGDGAWLFTVLLAGVIALALTRIALTTKTMSGPFGSESSPRQDLVSTTTLSMPAGRRTLGDDPRSRVLNSYVGFEESLARVGHPRMVFETESTHVRRSIGVAGLDEDLASGLVDRHASARFAESEPSVADAVDAEEAARRLIEGMEQ